MGLFEFLIEVMYPLFLAPFAFGWLAKIFALRKVWTYLSCVLLDLCFPFILMAIYPVKDGAANAALIAWPIFLIPVTLLLQLIANFLFFRLVPISSTSKP